LRFRLVQRISASRDWVERFNSVLVAERGLDACETIVETDEDFGIAADDRASSSRDLQVCGAAFILLLSESAGNLTGRKGGTTVWNVVERSILDEIVYVATIAKFSV